MVRCYRPEDEDTLLALWNTSGVCLGYAPLGKAAFRKTLTGHPAFSPALTFLLEEAGDILGFVSGSCPPGTRGYVTCLILKKESEPIARQLLTALEAEFKNRGLHQSAVSFFHPVRLPWVLPGTGGHRHNNMPGVPSDLPMYGWFRDFGYRETSRECAMHLDLEGYESPAWVEEKASRMAKEGYRVERYDPARHIGLQEMVDSLGNPQWSAEIPAAGKDGMNLLVGLKGNTCAGFAGPVYPEDTGRGYFSGIGVAPEFEHHGLGTLLFYRLIEAEKAAGARYLSLFTGEENPAGKIYQGAGFQTKRTFGVFVKELCMGTEEAKMVELQKIATEQRNPNTMNIDTLSTLDMVKLINREDHRVAEAVALVTDKIAEAIDVIAEHLKKGGRLIYCGAGTSGRLGVLDAVECPPTYSSDPEMVQALMAGGMGAIFKAVEGAEDSRELGKEDMARIAFSRKDVLVGIAASGRTSYVLGCMEYAKALGAPTVAVTCCPGSAIDQFADIGIAPAPGPEVITGSTRMKSGTAQKMVLNMLSTGTMIRLGKVYGNLMVDVKPSNEKLVKRCVTIVCSATGCGEEAATAALEACGYRPKTAIVMIEKRVDAEEAGELLERAGGRIAQALE